MFSRIVTSSRVWKNSAGEEACASLTESMVVPIRRGHKQGGAAAVAPAREAGDGPFAVYPQPNGHNGHMQSASKAQFELERIEKQIEQLEAVTGQNQEARRKLQQLHERVNAVRQQIHAQLSAWQKTELPRHPQRPYML